MTIPELKKCMKKDLVSILDKHYGLSIYNSILNYLVVWSEGNVDKDVVYSFQLEAVRLTIDTTLIYRIMSSMIHVKNIDVDRYEKLYNIYVDFTNYNDKLKPQGINIDLMSIEQLKLKGLI